jgi:hypothetical protein
MAAPVRFVAVGSVLERVNLPSSIAVRGVHRVPDEQYDIEGGALRFGCTGPVHRP